MAGLMLQRLPGGATRVVPAGARTQVARARAAGLGLSGVQHMGRVGEVRPGAGLSLGGILRGAVRGVGGFLTGGIPGAVSGILSGGGGGTPPPPPGGTAFPRLPGGRQFQPLAAGCPEGFVFRNGRCERTGLRGMGERIVPGGATGFLDETAGEAVLGAFGIPALVPLQVGTIQRRDGSEGPILKCPASLVLGKDDLCYPKGVIPRKFRKHPPSRKPPVSARDAEAIRRAERAKVRVKRLATNVGFSCRKR